MSMYNLMNGVSPVAFIFLPMLGKHPDEYPRFRDCFLRDEEHPEHDGCIQVYTRAGGGNRESYQAEIDKLRLDENYVTDFDDSFDSTHVTFVFKVPEKWKKDFDAINTNIQLVSPEYQAELIRVYPKLEQEFKKLFSRKPEET